MPIGASGDVTVTAAPSVETTAEDGTKITLVNLDNVFIELQDESVLAGSKLRLGVPKLRLNQYEAISLQYVSAADAWIKLNNAALGALAAGYFKALDVPGPASDAEAGYFSARALRFKQISGTEDPTNADAGDNGSLIYGGSSLDISGRRQLDGKLLARLFDILLISAELTINRAGRDPNYIFAVSESVAKDAALIDGFLKIVKSLGVNADSDDSLFSDALAPKVVVNGNVILNGILRIISTLNLDSVAASKPLFTDADKNLIAQNIDLFFGSYFDNYLPIARGGTEATTAAGARTNLSVYSKAEVDSLLAGKADAGHTHSISFYSGTAGDPPHEHLVQGTTGIDQ